MARLTRALHALLAVTCAGLAGIAFGGAASAAPDGPPAQPASNSAPTLFDLPDPSARAFAMRYYRDEGEFKGQYVIAEVLRTRRQTYEPTRFLYHVRYRFRCTLSTCCCGAAGIDQRYFEFTWLDGRWRVTRMGGHMSGRL